ncbi:MAG: 2-amino-4-hydroxy-6-hydroxymethyldihydropteridine diphosphokinase [Desulfobacterales bacterium]|jgi:2-amino-4-hydroxy-6-hydroxymethyldihydropteridine diphosphokinase
MVDLHIAYISAGSNMEDRLQNCRKGIESLTTSGNSRILTQSRIYKTEPVDYEDQDWFINMMIKLETAYDPFQLLDRIEDIQRAAGRWHDPIRFGPRILDLDIILYDDRIIDAERLVVPHPRMHKRRFVLKPICDIDPSIVHPVLKQEMHFLLKQLGDENQKVFEYKCSNL